MRFSKIVRDKHGFTLVELVVTLAIFAILLAVAGNYLFFGNRMFTETEKKNSEKFIGDSVFQFMQEKLTYAGAIQILPSDSEEEPKYDHLFKLSKNTENSEDKTGYLLFTNNYKEKEPENLYGNGYYNNNRIDYKIKVEGEDKIRIHLTIEVFNQSGELAYHTGSVIKNLNIPIGTNSIECDSLEELLNPIISYQDAVEEEDPLVTVALGVRNNYVNTFEMLWKIKYEIEPKGSWSLTKVYNNSDWKKYCEESGFSMNNSPIRHYEVEKYYGGSWPLFQGFPKDVLERNTIVKNFFTTSPKKVLYYEPYTKDVTYDNGSTYVSDNCFVYLGEKANGDNWQAYFVYDHEKDNWYASVPNGSKVEGQWITGYASWEKLKEELYKEEKWKKIE